MSHDSRATFVRVSHDFPKNVAYLHFNLYELGDIRSSVARHSYECRLVLFSRQIVAMVSHVVSRLLRDRRGTLARHSWQRLSNFLKENFQDIISRDVNEYSNVRIFAFHTNIRMRFLDSNIRIIF